MNALKRFFIKAHLLMIVILALLMLVFSAGTDNAIMVFIFGVGICYAVIWMILYIAVIGTLQDIWDIFKE